MGKLCLTKTSEKCQGMQKIFWDEKLDEKYNITSSKLGKDAESVENRSSGYLNDPMRFPKPGQFWVAWCNPLFSNVDSRLSGDLGILFVQRLIVR